MLGSTATHDNVFDNSVHRPPPNPKEYALFGRTYPLSAVHVTLLTYPLSVNVKLSLSNRGSLSRATHQTWRHPWGAKSVTNFLYAAGILDSTDHATDVF